MMYCINFSQPEYTNHQKENEKIMYKLQMLHQWILQNLVILRECYLMFVIWIQLELNDITMSYQELENIKLTQLRLQKFKKYSYLLYQQMKKD